MKQAHSMAAPLGGPLLSRPSLGATLDPPIYLISLLPWATAALTAPAERQGPLALGGLGVLAIQHGVNVLNDRTDGLRGADSEKPASWLRYHHNNPRHTALHGTLSALLGVILGVCATGTTGQWGLLALALPFVALGLLYNEGPKPLAYGPAGEWATAACYAVVGLALCFLGNPLEGTRAAQVGLAYGALAFGVLLAHQPPQVLTDRLAGKRTFAVRHGVQTTRAVSRGAFVAFAIGLTQSNLTPGLAGETTVRLLAGVAVALWTLSKRPSPARWLQGAALGVGLNALVGGLW